MELIKHVIFRLKTNTQSGSHENMDTTKGVIRTTNIDITAKTKVTVETQPEVITKNKADEIVKLEIHEERIQGLLSHENVNWKPEVLDRNKQEDPDKKDEIIEQTVHTKENETLLNTDAQNTNVDVNEKCENSYKNNESREETQLENKVLNELSLYEKYNIIVEKETQCNVRDDSAIYENTNIINNFSLERIDENNISNENVLGTEFVEGNNGKQEDSAENLLLDLNPQEWLDLDEFENIIKDLSSVSSSDFCDIEEVIERHTIDKYVSNDNAKENKANTSTVANNESVNDQKASIDVKTTEEDVICISSDEDADFKLNISLDDLETVSLSSIEALCDNNNDSNKLINSSVQVLSESQDSGNIILIEENNNSISVNSNTKATDCGPEREIQPTETVTKLSSKTLTKAKKDTIEDIIQNKPKEDSKTIAQLKENELDTISIISNGSDGEDDYCSGYNSSDFEFITEEEAKRHGFIINYIKNRPNITSGNNETCRTVEVTTDSEINCSNSSQISESHLVDMPGPSHQEASPNVYERANVVVDYNYRRNHNIPEGDQFYNLFNGYFMPTTPYMYENKSMHSIRHVQYEGLGFDMRAVRRPPAEDDAEYKMDAEESAKKILFMYPGENKKRRRRF